MHRSDIYSLSSSPDPSEPDSELTALFHSRLKGIYGPVFADTAPAAAFKSVETAHDLLDATRNNHDGWFEFRLFAGSFCTATGSTEGQNSRSPVITTRITIADDAQRGADNQGGFTVRSRDSNYYFAAPASAAQRRAFATAAVSGEDVRRNLDVRYTGWAMPWRVRVLRSTAATAIKQGGRGGAHEEEADGGRRKKKPGKKRRVVLRVRKRKADEQRERREKEELEREAREREKRTRRNREKKVKRKMKEKAKKEATAVGGIGASRVGESDGGGTGDASG